MLTTKQMRLVQAVKKYLGDEETYRHLLRESTGVESARVLDNIGLNAFVREAKRLGFRHTSATSFGARRGMATPKQVAMIRKLWADWSTIDASEKALNAWLERSYSVSALRFLSFDAAGKAINGLRTMMRRKAEVDETADRSTS
ncbi:regulatory protein GemA [Methylocystis sp.]|uniref:regulatory protein GemA n=1 Tax=Methylocystis sp. TaxID=1911079 RepID=UPI003D0E5609